MSTWLALWPDSWNQAIGIGTVLAQFLLEPDHSYQKLLFSLWFNSFWNQPIPTENMLCSLWSNFWNQIVSSKHFLVSVFQAVWIFAKMKSYLSTLFEVIPLSGTLVSFMFRNSSPSSCTFQTEWTELTKNDLENKWPGWGTFEFPKLAFLKTEMENHSYKVVKTELNAYID